MTAKPVEKRERYTEVIEYVRNYEPEHDQHFLFIDHIAGKLDDGVKLSHQEVAAAEAWIDHEGDWRKWLDIEAEHGMAPDVLNKRLTQHVVRRLRKLEHAAIALDDGVTIGAVDKRDERRQVRLRKFEVLSLDAAADAELDDIAAPEGIDRGTIIDLRARWDVLEERQREVFTDLILGRTQVEAAARHGVGERTVRRWLADFRAAA